MRRAPVTNKEVDLYDLLCDTFDELNDLRDSYETLKDDLELALDDISDEIESIDARLAECRKAFRLFRRRPSKFPVFIPEGECPPPKGVVISCIPEGEDDEKLPF